MAVAKVKHASTLGDTFQALIEEITGQGVYDNIDSSRICRLQNALNKRIVLGRENV
jgi:hypothetical protein